MAFFDFKRRKVVVDADLQAGLAFNMMGWLYFYVVMFAVVVNGRAIWAVLTSSESDPEYFDAVQRLEWFTRFSVVPLIAMLVCIAVHGVVSAHRVAGPIVRIKQALRDIANRSYPPTPLTLRPKDYFKDIATELTTVLDMLRDDAARVRRINAETVAGARETLVAIDEGRLGRDEIAALARATLERAERCDRHLAETSPVAVGAGAPAQPAPAAPAAAPAASA
jgi:hypothetical protein